MSVLVKHFVTKPKAILALNELEVDSDEKQQLAETITLIYHQKLLNRFLEILSEEDSKLFLEDHLNGSHDKSVTFLREKIENIEDVVEEAIAEIEEKILSDINSLKG